MTSTCRRFACTLWLLLALGAARAATGQTIGETQQAALRLRIFRDSAPINATCVLVSRDVRERDVVMYFVTAGHLFKSARGQALPYPRSLTVDIGGGGALEVQPQDVSLTRGHMDVAVFKVTTRSTSLVPPALTLAVPAAGSSFFVSGFDSIGKPVQAVQRVRRVATLMLTGDRAMPLVAGCAGAPAIGEHGVFGIVSTCEPDQLPVIVPFSAAAAWIEGYVPGGLALQRPVQTRFEFIQRIFRPRS